MSEHKNKLKKIAHPENYGPYWTIIHKKAFKATTPEKKLRYEQFVHDLIEELDCDHCREDALRYLKEHPIRAFFNVKDEKSGSDIGCFKHSWLFHNYVNRKLGKKEIDWMTALGMFAEHEGCQECGQKEVDHDSRGKHKKDGKNDGRYEKEAQIKVIGKYRH